MGPKRHKKWSIDHSLDKEPEVQSVRWFGQIQRSEQNTLIKKILGEQKTGRPKTRLKYQIYEDMRKMNITDSRRKVKNKKEWKKITEMTGAISIKKRLGKRTDIQKYSEVFIILKSVKIN